MFLALNLEGGNKKFKRRILFPPPLPTVLAKGKQEGTGEAEGKRDKERKEGSNGTQVTGV